MLKFKWVIGAVLFAAAGVGRAADDEVFDLRGPAPEKGQVFVSKSRIKITDADTVLKVEGQTQELKLTRDITSEEEATVLAADGRNVTKCKTKVVQEQEKATIKGQPMALTESTALEGKTFISTRDGKTWKHSLVDDKTTDKIKKELDNRNGIESDDDLYPKEKVKVGHAWKVEAAALTKMLGNSFTDVKGTLNQKFLKTEDVDGEKCAVIESSGKITAKIKDDGEPTVDVEMELELKIVTHRSIKTGVAVKEKFDGKIKLEGTQKMDDVKVEIKMSGPISGTSTTKLK